MKNIYIPWDLYVLRRFGDSDWLILKFVVYSVRRQLLNKIPSLRCLRTVHLPLPWKKSINIIRNRILFESKKIWCYMSFFIYHYNVTLYTIFFYLNYFVVSPRKFSILNYKHYLLQIRSWLWNTQIRDEMTHNKNSP